VAENSTVPRIRDDWLNDYTAYQRCFVCGQRNPSGLHAVYRQEGDRIVTEFTGHEVHEGYPGVVHGGLLATLLDETMGRAALFSAAWTMTGRLEVRYRAPAPTHRQLVVTAWLTRERRHAFEARGEVRIEGEELVAEGRGLFLRVPDSVREQAERDTPEFAPYFRNAIPHTEESSPPGRPGGGPEETGG
jgi:acyl-coenzyme A thioesterase PaaI-like protein